MKKILVPIDFSHFSLNAAKTAVFMAKKTHADIHLLHVVSGPGDWHHLPPHVQQEYPQVEARIVEAEIRMEKLTKDPMFGDCEVTSHVEGGVIYDQIVKFAKLWKMNLIVIGAHGAGETDQLFIGSTTQRVIRMANCPVLSVKKDIELKSIQRILFVSDFEEDVTYALYTVKELAAITHAEVDLLFVNTPGTFSNTEAAEKRMAKYIPDDKSLTFSPFIYDDFDKETGMLNFIKRRRPDLVAMVTHGRKGKPAYYMSVTDTLLFHADVPVLSTLLQHSPVMV